MESCGRQRFSPFWFRIKNTRSCSETMFLATLFPMSSSKRCISTISTSSIVDVTFHCDRISVEAGNHRRSMLKEGRGGEGAAGETVAAQGVRGREGDDGATECQLLKASAAGRHFGDETSPEAGHSGEGHVIVLSLARSPATGTRRRTGRRTGTGTKRKRRPLKWSCKSDGRPMRLPWKQWLCACNEDIPNKVHAS